MSEKRFKTLTIIIEDDTGTVQTHIRSDLSALQLMDKIFELKKENEQLKKQLEIRTESDKYHQRMLMKWLCKDDGDGV